MNIKVKSNNMVNYYGFCIINSQSIHKTSHAKSNIYMKKDIISKL